MAAPVTASIELGPSRLACAAIAGVALAACATLLTIPVPLWLDAVAAGGLAAWSAERIAVVGLRRGPRAVRGIRLDDGGRLGVVFGSGRVVAGTLHGDSRAGPRLTSVVWRPDGARLTRSILILPDMLPADDFRRFRVLMLHGGPGSDR